MRITKIEIENFRNYFGLHTFDLEKEITIIYGDNGFGKSSFFDAIEWCLTGSISRFSINNIDKNVIANHLALNTQTDCSVAIHFGNNILRRRFEINNNGFGNVSVKVVRKNGNLITEGEQAVNEYLQNYNTSKQNNYLDNVGKLIKKAYILSQDQMNDFISNDKASDRFNALVNIMSLEKVYDFLDNLKFTIKQLDKAINEQTRKIRDYQNIINESSARLDTIDMTYINNSLDYIQLKDYKNTVEFRNAIRNKKEFIMKQQYEIETVKKISTQFLNMNFSSISDVERRINYIDKKVYEVKDTINKNNLKLQENNNKSRLIHERLNNFEKIFKYYRERETIEQKLDNVKKQLEEMFNNPELNEEVLVNMKIEYMNEYQYLNYANKYKKEYEEFINNISIFPNKLKILKNDLSRLDKAKLDNESEINRINKLILNDNLNSLTFLKKCLFDLKNYVGHNDVNGTCPVCSTNHGEKLNNILLENIDDISKKIEHQSIQNDYLNEQKSVIEFRNNEIAKVYENIEYDIKLHEKTYENARLRIKKIEGNEYFEKSLFKLNLNEIENRIKHLEEKLLKLNDAINLLFEKDNLMNTNTKLSENMKLDEMDLVDKSQLKDELDKLLKDAKTIISNSNSLKDVISKYESEKANIFYLHREAINKMNIKDSLYSFIHIIEDYNTKEDKLSQESLLLSRAEEDINKYESCSNVFKIISKAERDIVELEKKKIYWEEKKLALSNITDKVYSIYGEGIESFFNNHNSAIKRYFRYLNPLPVENDIKFEISGDELEIFIKPSGVEFCEDNKTKALYTLSSGQLNTLALAIFLATNESKKMSFLDFVAIDDPIQNMDDVNRFSVCDVLSSIDKQLIFSTHDFEFLKLFIKKNESRKNEIRIYKLESNNLSNQNITRIDM
jgi:exonuclease SbcC